MIGNALLWGSLIWMPIMLYVMLRNETKFKKNIAIGVTLPFEGRKHPDVLARLEKFKKDELKLCIGLITGFVAHKVFALSQEKQRKVSLPVATVISCACGMGFNIVADPVVGYFYKTYVLGVPQDAAAIWAKMGAVTTSVNAVVAVIAATVFYLILRPALKRSKLLPTVR